MKKTLVAFLLISSILSSCFYSKKNSYDYKYKEPATVNDLNIHQRNSLEWWYFASHLNSKDGVQYGVMLTLFKRNYFVNKTGYMLNCIITNNKDTIAQKWVRFYPNKKKYLTQKNYIVKINNKSVDFSIEKIKGDSVLVAMQSKDGKLPSLSFTHQTQKNLLKQTTSGYMHYGKTGTAGYLSYTNTNTKGYIKYKNNSIQLTGKTWIDKQWNCMSIVTPSTSWIWMGIQFNNNEECMLFNFYNTQKKENHLQGTYIDKEGNSKYFTIDKTNWVEQNNYVAKSKYFYPTHITFTIPELQKTIKIVSPFYDHEIDIRFLGKSKMTYWESKCEAIQITNNDTIKGAAFLEMTNIHNRNLKN